MNAAGISVFYGADSDATALAEVRPPVGSDVAIARFEITRPLRLLDLTALDNIVIEDSVFDPAYEDRLEKAAFLKTLSRRLSAAILPDDETLAYLPTQAVADYLSGMNNPTLDGIIFPSVQSATRGLNIVFFQKASRVQDLDLPPNAEVGLSLWHIDPDDQWDFEYQVQERDPAQSRVSPLGSNAAGIDILPIVPTWTPDFSDKREVALRVDVKSVCVHHITGVEIQSRAIKVVRKRVGKGEGDD